MQELVRSIFSDLRIYRDKDRYKSRDWEIRSGLVYNKDFRALE